MFVFSAQFAALMALFGVGIMVIRWIDGVLEPEHVYNFFLYVGFAPLILFLLLVVAGYIWRITITPDTLRCPTKYGRYYTVSWASIRSVAPEAQLGFSVPEDHLVRRGPGAVAAVISRPPERVRKARRFLRGAG